MDYESALLFSLGSFCFGLLSGFVSFTRQHKSFWHAGVGNRYGVLFILARGFIPALCVFVLHLKDIDPFGKGPVVRMLIIGASVEFLIRSKFFIGDYWLGTKGERGLLVGPFDVISGLEAFFLRHANQYVTDAKVHFAHDQAAKFDSFTEMVQTVNANQLSYTWPDVNDRDEFDKTIEKIRQERASEHAALAAPKTASPPQPPVEPTPDVLFQLRLVYLLLSHVDERSCNSLLRPAKSRERRKPVRPRPVAVQEIASEAQQERARASEAPAVPASDPKTEAGPSAVHGA